MRSLQIFILTLLAFLFLISEVQAQIIGPSVKEIRFQYSASFLSDNTDQPENLAYEHANHIFGLLHSPEVVQRFGLDPDLIDGVGAPRADMDIQVLKTEVWDNSRLKITYKNSGLMIMQRQAAAKALRGGGLTLPMPFDLQNIYDQKCTDPHYDSIGDYWYFWNPFQKNCTYLQKPPHGNPVRVKMQASRMSVQESTPRLDLLRGNNDNGAIFSIYVIHGFDESSRQKSDEGRRNSEQLDRYLIRQKFSVKNLSNVSSRTLKLFTKEIVLDNGKNMQVEVRHLLVDTNIDSRSVAFAQFFKEAVQNADVIVYEGHSGLGGNLDIPSLEAKAGEFVFNAKKRQIYFFDSCSSYSYYLTSFKAEKTRAKIDIISNGLMSGFDASTEILTNFLEILLDPEIDDLDWMSVLKKMEEPLEGGSYLLNVGGV